MMTNIYESELLYKLMERDGLNVPSSIPPYESEIKDFLIDQVKLAYPKLTDYEAEWLLYNYTKHLPAEFPIETITNVTDATVNNVVPYAYKSAILKGQTLVNLCNGFKNHVILDKNTPLANLNIPYKLQAKKYALICEVSNFNAPIAGVSIWITYSDGEDRYYNKLANTNGKLVYLFEAQKEIDEFRVYIHGDDKENGGFFGIGELMLIEYQDGMENWDIPYFEGMASVKMPVLTTSNGDGTKTNILTCNEDVTLRSNGSVCDELDLLTGKLTQRIGEIVLDGSESWNGLKDGELTNSFYLNINNITINSIITVNSSVFKPVTYSSLYSSDVECISNHNSQSRICVRINKSKLSSSNVNGFKLWLQSNPLKVQYLLTEKSIKTVDLSVVDENGNEIKHFMPIEGTMHIQTDGEPIKPSVTMEIPVEATTQNLASFIEKEV